MPACLAKGAAIIVFSMLSISAGAECVRWKPLPKLPNAAPEFDGPGSFGKLQDTVTLGCLQYVGSIQKKNVEHVLIKDETGTIHTLRAGDYMGENSGIISKIDQDTIHITQLVKRNGRIEEVAVKFPKNKPAK
jgi:hypothetical protein